MIREIEAGKREERYKVKKTRIIKYHWRERGQKRGLGKEEEQEEMGKSEPSPSTARA